MSAEIPGRAFPETKKRPPKSERQLTRAARYADKLMADVPKSHPAYEDLWFTHLYGYYLEHNGGSEALDGVIENRLSKIDYIIWPEQAEVDPVAAHVAIIERCIFSVDPMLVDTFDAAGHYEHLSDMDQKDALMALYGALHELWQGSDCPDKLDPDTIMAKAGILEYST